MKQIRVFVQRNDWLDQWQSGKLSTGSRVQSFSRAFPSPTDVPVLLLNQPIFLAATAPFPKSRASCFALLVINNTSPPYYLRAWHRLIGANDSLHLTPVSSHCDRPSFFKTHTYCCLALLQMFSIYFIPVCFFSQNRFLKARSTTGCPISL